jgi:hypothetical protein
MQPVKQNRTNPDGVAACEELSATPSKSLTPRVHKRVLRMVTLRRDHNENFGARKRLPADVASNTGAGTASFEAKLFAAASKGTAEAKRLFQEWEAEVAKRVAAALLIRAALPDWRNCEPITATRAQRSWSGLPT